MSIRKGFFKLHGLVLELVELIDAKGICGSTYMAVRLSDISSKTAKNTKNSFFACYWAYVGQHHGHTGWATSMPFASINSTTSRNFHKKILRIGDFETFFFFGQPFLFFFQFFLFIFFLFIPLKISHKLCVRIDGTQFLLLWFTYLYFFSVFRVSCFKG